MILYNAYNPNRTIRIKLSKKETNEIVMQKYGKVNKENKKRGR